MLLVLGLVFGGLVFQLAQGWVSVAGDCLWLAGFLLFTVAAVTEPQRPQTTIGQTSTFSFALLGLGAAALMVYWILVDSRQIARSGDLLTIPLVVIAVVGVIARIGAKRTTRH
jgi:apolipoprotein N-acyltransferase